MAKAYFAVLDPAHDVGGRHVVARRDEEDHRRDRRHRGDEGIDEGGEDRRADERQHDAAEGLRAAPPPWSGSLSSMLRSIWARAAMPARMPTWHVAEDEADHEDDHGAGDVHREKRAGHESDRGRRAAERRTEAEEGAHELESSQAPPDARGRGSQAMRTADGDGEGRKGGPEPRAS